MRQADLQLLIDALKDPMRTFVRESRVRICILVNGAGQVLSQHGFTRTYEVMNVASLAASANASARAIADVASVQRFKHMHHAGKQRQLFLAPLRTPMEELILVAIFDEDSSLGLVQVYFDRLVAELSSMPQFARAKQSSDVAMFEKDLEGSLEGLFGGTQEHRLMSLVNYSTREITCKIVYYGPGRSGKTTNLQYIHAFVPDDRKGAMVSLATETDRTLFFDFLPLDLGSISGFRTRLQLYTVPGQVYYNATRKLVLRGADGVVFVADSQPQQFDDNIESLRNLHDNLVEQNLDVRDLPLVIQYNKRDLPGVMPIDELEDALNFRGVPSYGAAAVSGDGVFDTLRGISDLVLRSLSKKFNAEADVDVGAVPDEAGA